jgi:hypothetical protein
MKKLLLITTLLGFSGTTLAGPNPFKDCGIGAALFENTPWAAVTSNTIWDAGTTAVTSATASPETCSNSNPEVKTSVFILENFESVEQELLEGEGEYVSNLGDIMGCSVKETSAMVEEVRGEMSEKQILTEVKVEKAEDLYLKVVNTPTGKSCLAV